MATAQNRFVVTQDEDFKKIVKPNKPGVFILSSELSNEKIDNIVTKFLSGKDPENFIGKAVKI